MLEVGMNNSKKCKLHLQLSFLLTIVISVNTTSQILNESSPFPIQIGNEWVHSSQSDTLTEVVVDTQRIGGNLYYSFDKFRNSSGYLFRIFDNKVFIYADTAEYLWYDFNSDIGNSWNVPQLGPPYFGGEFTMESKTDTVITPIGIFTDCYRIHHIIGVDAEFTEWFANEIGIVQRDVITIVGLRRWILIDKIITSNNFEINSLPSSYLLSQNYPNPFNPSTIINYQIPEINFVTLKVFNALGNEITTLVNEEKPVGEYEVNFNGSELPSGVYFYRIQAGDFIETKKMILIK
ncbi:MAG: T9SS type A sorting domain-containing protein [Candidatus Thorarchaeota archaeon]